MMMKRKVFQLNSELYKVTGIQRVLLDIHEALKDDFEAKIAGFIPYDKIDRSLGVSEKDYIRFRNPLKFRDSVVIIHERRLLPLMWLLTHVPGLNAKCVYVHHSVLYGNKRLSLFPENIVAISDAGIRNLIEYFGVPRANITKIHNCVRATAPHKPRTRTFDPGDITILYPARINSGKRQIEIVNYLRGKLDPRVKILFAGIGPLYDEFSRLCKDDPQFRALGFRGDIPDLMKNVDFMLLFSKNEGLPISLIEATMLGTPIICNDVGGNCEIVENGNNGVVVDDWNSLAACLNSLPLMTLAEYDSLTLDGPNIAREKFGFDLFRCKYQLLIKNLLDD